MASKEISSIRTMKSKLTPKSLSDIMKRYHIDPEFRLRLPKLGDAIVATPEGFVGVYRVFFKPGLRLPTFEFLEVVLDYYHLHIAQITPNGFRKIIYMLCSTLDFMPFITVFHQIYVPISNGD
ncbi:unnamed protein product [Lactuca virosa]|uniref:Transposase (putative) gypsy type domain-containing protein n=1 Tax=Lactuca virosa TaxID=75947 RepID=A0AAU9MZA2_9ASTR|nr:unnamed protein product [Lactuca virosa]